MPAGLFAGARLRTAAILVAMCTVAFVLRTALLWDRVFRSGYVSFQDSDAWFHMRLIDNLVRNLPHRMSVDPYASYPDAQDVAVVPLFDFLVAVTLWVIGLGTPSPRTVDVVGALAPAVLGTVMPVLVYVFGKRVFDRLTGFFAAGLIAVLPHDGGASVCLRRAGGDAEELDVGRHLCRARAARRHARARDRGNGALRHLRGGGGPPRQTRLPRRVLVGPNPRVPCVPVEALTTLRLLHDSPDTAARATKLPSVRIFESLRAGR